jgi:hypothetical protein
VSRTFQIGTVAVEGNQATVTAVAAIPAPTVTLPIGDVSTSAPPPVSLTVRVPFKDGEALPEFRARACVALCQAAVEQDHTMRRGEAYAAALAGIEVVLAEPEPLEFGINGAKLDGSFGPSTKHALLTLRDKAGALHERLITPNRNRRFSVWMGDWTFVSLVPVSTDGLLGDEQTGG